MQTESGETHREVEQLQGIVFELHKRILAQLPPAGAIGLPAARGGVNQRLRADHPIVPRV